MLSPNMECNGFCVAGYDLDAERVKSYVEKHPNENLVAYSTFDEILAILERPCCITMMVSAVKAVDSAVASSKDARATGDLLICSSSSFPVGCGTPFEGIRNFRYHLHWHWY